MHIEINGVKVNYTMRGHGKDLILLHGWGGSIRSFSGVEEHLQNHFRTFCLDFPGFGSSDTPPERWGVDNYVQTLKCFIDQLNIKEPILLAHSFGGRVAIKFASMALVRKLILIDSAGIKPDRTLSYYVKVYIYKFFKFILLLPGIKSMGEPILEKYREKVGSSDYKNLKGVMQRTLVKVVNEDLQSYLTLIPVPTLLVWGEKDTATPLSDAKLMEKLIPDAGLVIFKGAGHFSYLERLQEFLIIIDKFLEKEKES